MLRRLFARQATPQERVDLRTETPPGGMSLYAGGGGLIVVGTVHYADAISRVTGRMGPKGVSMTAALVSQPQNPYDPNAVAVVVNGLQIGHLRREDAKAYKPVMAALHQRGLTGYCRVDIRPDANPKFMYSVRVYLDTPDRQLQLIERR